MNMPFFSVIIPLFNKEKHIKRTLESVLKQTFKDFEIIIIDDGSSDNSYEIVQSISDDRIILVKQKNKGVSQARNNGIRKAKGKYITFLDADDEWVPEKLNQHFELHNGNPNLVWSCSAYRKVSYKNERDIIYSIEGVLPNTIEAIINGLKIWTGTVIVNKGVFKEKRFLFNISLSNSEDRELWFKLACIYPKIGYISEVLAIYNIDNENSLTSVAYSNSNFSFLSMASRLEVEMKSLSDKQKENLLNYIHKFNKIAIFHAWLHSDVFKKNSFRFEGIMDKSSLNFLEKYNSLPVIIKKIYIKLLIK